MRTSSGVKGFDSFLEGGFPRGISVILQGPSGVEKELFYLHFIIEGLSIGENVIVVLSSKSPEKLLQRLSEYGIDMKKMLDERKLVIIDWFTHKIESIKDVKDEGAILRCSADIKNVSIALSKVLSRIEQGSVRAVVEVLSPALSSYTVDEIYKFAQACRAKFDQKNTTALFLLEKEMHDQAVISSLQQPFDGVVDIVREKVQDTIVRKIGVLSMKDSEVPSKYETLNISRNDVWIAEKKEPTIECPKCNAAIAKSAECCPSCKLEVKRFLERLLMIDKQIKANPNNPNAWFARGMTLSDMGLLEKALKCFETALKLDEKRKNAWNAKAEIYTKMGRHEDAAKSYKKALDLAVGDMDSKVRKSFAEEHAVEDIIQDIAKDDAEKTRIKNLQDSDERIKKDENDAEAWFSKSAILIRMGKFREALNCLHEVTRTDLKYPEVWTAKGDVYTKLGDHKKAAMCYQRAQEHLDERVACPICGNYVDFNDLRCNKCGIDFEQDAEKEEESEPEFVELGIGIMEVRPKARETKPPAPKVRPEIVKSKREPTEVKQGEPGIVDTNVKAVESKPYVRQVSPEKPKVEHPDLDMDAMESDLKIIEELLKGIKAKPEAPETKEAAIKPVKEEPKAFDIRKPTHAKISDEKGLTNGLVREKAIADRAGRITGRTNGQGKINGLRTGKTNGLVNGTRVDRTNGLVNGRKAGRINGLVNGKGRVNGIVNGTKVGKINGIINGQGRINGLINGIRAGKVNGLVNGFSSVKLGLTNGLTNGRGITNGLGSSMFRKESAMKNWKMFLIPIIAAMLLYIPYSSTVRQADYHMITIDGNFDDWNGHILTMERSTVLNPSIDIVGVGVENNEEYLAFYIETGSTIFRGGNDLVDTFHIFIDSDKDYGTGYRINNIGADRMISIYGKNGEIKYSDLNKFNISRDAYDWNGWMPAGNAQSVASGTKLETQVGRETLGGESDVDVFFYAQSYGKEQDFAEHTVSNADGILDVVSQSTASEILSGDNNAILSLELNALQDDIEVTEIGIELTGNAAPSEIRNIRLYDQDKGLLGENAPTGESVIFSFSTSIRIPEGTTKELVVLADVRGTSGNTLGATLNSQRDIKIQSGTVSLRKVPSTYNVGYLGVVPSTTTIDGGFSEWTSPNIDFELQPVQNQNVDLKAFNITTDSSNINFYLDVQGGIMSGALVPHWNLVTGEPYYSSLVDSDRDRIPDEVDPCPNDFNNDQVPDLDSNFDVDDDGVLDYPYGDDMVLNMTIANTTMFPPEFRGKDVSVYIGPNIKPVVKGEDVARIYMDTDNDPWTGFHIEGVGADYLLEIRGRDGVVMSKSVLAFSAAYWFDWNWTSTGITTNLETGYAKLEGSVDLAALGAIAPFATYIETTDWSGIRDTSEQLMTKSVSLQEGSKGTSTLIDASSEIITSNYNNQRKVVRAGDVAGDSACDASNSDGCYYDIFSEQATYTKSYTKASTEAVTTGSKVAGTFPGDIQTENDAYIQYRETGDTIEALAAYRSNTGSYKFYSPKTKGWDGSSWGSETELSNASSPVRAVRMAWSPTAVATRIIVMVGDDGYLDAYVCTPTCSLTGGSNIGQVWSSLPSEGYKWFDVAYEQTSGEALLVYGILSTNVSRDIGYKTYSGGSWSPEQYINDTGHNTDIQYTTMVLSPKKGSNQIGLIARDDTDDDVNAWIWDGSAFGNYVSITDGSASDTREHEDIAWESNSGNLLAVSVQLNNYAIISKEYTTSWSSASTYNCGTSSGRHFVFIRLKANPLSTANDMILAGSDTASTPDLSTCYWDGSSWGGYTNHDTNIESTANTRGFDFAWESTGSKGLLVYGDDPLDITYHTFTAPSGWGGQTDAPMGTYSHPSVQLSTNPSPVAGGPKILGAVMEDTVNDLGAIKWNGTAFTVIGTGTITADTGTTSYDAYEMEYWTTNIDQLLVYHNWTGVPAGDSYTLQVKGYTEDEGINVQVLTPPSTWNTRITISATSNTMYTYALTSSEYNSGAPSIKFVDANGAGSPQTDLWVDYSNIIAVPEGASNTQPSSQYIAMGSKVSGTFPTSIQTNDGTYLQYGENTDGSEALAAYRSNTGTNTVNSPKTRTWDGSSWSSESELATAGSPIPGIRMAWSPTDPRTKIIVTIGEDRYLDAYVCMISCSATNNIGFITSALTPPSVKFFDIAYEQLSGDALLVYSVSNGDSTKDIAYKTYVSGSWSTEQYIDDTTESLDVSYRTMVLAAKKGSNQIGLVARDGDNDDTNAWIWDGSAWGNFAEITSNADGGTREREAIAWETSSGHLLAVSTTLDSPDIAWREYTTSWSSPATYTCGPTDGANNIDFLRLKPNPAGNDMILGAQNWNDFSTCYWSGSSWSNRIIHDASIDATETRGFDFAWESTGSKGILVRGTDNGVVTYRTFTAPNTWGTNTTASMGSGTHIGVALDTNPLPHQGGSKVIGAVLENRTGTYYLGAIKWDGTTLTSVSSSSFTSDVSMTGAPYDPYDIKYHAIEDDALRVRYDWTGVPAGDTYALEVKGYREDENLLVQVLTPPSTWNTRITLSATTPTMYTYNLTSAEYNYGAPSVRIVDSGGPGGFQSYFWLDYVNIVSYPAWDRVVLMRSSNTAGTTWGSQIVLASGRTNDSPLILSRESTEPSIAIDSGGYLHVVWASANSAGSQPALYRIRYTKTTVTYPTQSELASAGNWEAVTNVDDTNLGFMPTVSTDTNNAPHVAWSASKTAGKIFYKNKVGGSWRSTVTWGATGAPSTESVTTGSKVSGTFSGDVATEDSSYIRYRESTDSAQALAAYRSNTGTNKNYSPKMRTWDGSSWGSETELSNSSSVLRAVRMAWSPTSPDTRIVVSLGADGYLDAYVCTPTCTLTANISYVWSSEPSGAAWKFFDVAYEQTSGEGMLVYAVKDSNTARDLAYKTYISGSWSSEQYIDDTSDSGDLEYATLMLAPQKGSNKIGLVARHHWTSGVGGAYDTNAWIWDGSAWGNFAEITGDGETWSKEREAIAWESSSGHILAVSARASSNVITSKEYTTSWQPTKNFTCGANSAESLRFLSLKANPESSANDMMLAAADGNEDLVTCYWDGTNWKNQLTHHTDIDTWASRSFDFAWENSGSQGILVHGTTTNGQIVYKTFITPNTWGPQTALSMGTYQHNYTQLATNPLPDPGDARILGALLESIAADVGAVKWNGTALSVIGTSTFTADHGPVDASNGNYDVFDMDYHITNNDQALIYHNWSGLSAGDSYLLQVKGYREDENIDVQVLTPPSTWNTRITISATTNTLYTYRLTSSEFASGAPKIRFVDSSGIGGSQSDFWLDFVNVASTAETGLSVDVSPQNNYVSLARYYDASTNEIQYLVCKDLSTSNCDAASEFTKWNGAAGYDTVYTTVESASYPSLATTWDSNGDLWIAYTKSFGLLPNIYAIFLDYPSGGWQTVETVDSSGSISFGKPSIGVDQSGNVYCMYQDIGSSVTYVKMRSGGSWGSRTQVGTNAVSPGLMLRMPNHATYGQNIAGIYYESSPKETYHYVVPEFSTIAIPVFTIILLMVLRERRRRRKREDFFQSDGRSSEASLQD